jgi:hypothetical protein
MPGNTRFRWYVVIAVHLLAVLLSTRNPSGILSGILVLSCGILLWLPTAIWMFIYCAPAWRSWVVAALLFSGFLSQWAFIYVSLTIACGLLGDCI